MATWKGNWKDFELADHLVVPLADQKGTLLVLLMVSVLVAHLVQARGVQLADKMVDKMAGMTVERLAQSMAVLTVCSTEKSLAAQMAEK